MVPQPKKNKKQETKQKQPNHRSYSPQACVWNADGGVQDNSGLDHQTQLGTATQFKWNHTEVYELHLPSTAQIGGIIHNKAIMCITAIRGAIWLRRAGLFIEDEYAGPSVKAPCSHSQAGKAHWEPARAHTTRACARTHTRTHTQLRQVRAKPIKDGQRGAGRGV